MQGTESPLRATELPHLRVRWIVACEIAGALVICSAFAVEKLWRWTGVAPSTLVNLGTGLLLAGLLFLLERRFTTQVSTQTKAVVEAVDARIEEGARELETRLDELERRTEERVRRQGIKDDDAIEALDQVSFVAVTRALERANRLRALASSIPRVQASDDLKGVWLSFAWGTNVSIPPDRNSPVLILTAEFRPSGVERSRRLEVEWLSTQTADEVGARLIDELRRADYRGATLRWPLSIRNLQRTLRIAIQSKRREPDAWPLRGPVFELVGKDWAVTESGLEAPDHGYLLRESSFPKHAIGHGVGEASAGDRWTAPERPTWADPVEWEYLILRGRELFPRESEPSLSQRTWVPELGTGEG